MTSFEHEKLYHLDNNDNIRVWWMERDGANYRSHSGVDGGSIVTAGWKTAEAKNVGKSNETTPEDQALAEVLALYQKRIDRKYSRVRENAAKSNFINPMLAKTYDPVKSLKKNKHWILQPKFDGVRCLIDSNGGTSRSGKPFFTVQHIVEVLAKVSDEHNVTFDGELYNHDYRNDFEKLVSYIKQQKVEKLTIDVIHEIRAKIQFHIYDAIFWDEPDMSYQDRLARITEILAPVLNKTSYQPVVICESFNVSNLDNEIVEEIHGKFLQEGYEGIMLRDPVMPYEQKRSAGLLKHKNFIEDEFVLVDIIEGQGSWAGAAKSVVVRLKNGETSESGVAGSYERNADILARRDELIGTEVTVKFQGYTKEDKLRFGVVKVFHEGKRSL